MTLSNYGASNYWASNYWASNYRALRGIASSLLVASCGASASSRGDGNQGSPREDAAHPALGVKPPDTGGASGSNGSGGRATPSATGPADCAAPLTDQGGGFQRCANGVLHRAAAGVCPSALPRPDPLPFLKEYSEYTGGPDTAAYCNQDSDCGDVLHGHCELFIEGDVETQCLSGCVRDAECPPGNVCSCGDPVGSCVPASCRVDADCGERLLCASYTKDPRCTPTAFACQTERDECSVDQDCGPGGVCKSDGRQRLCTSDGGCLF